MSFATRLAGVTATAAIAAAGAFGATAYAGRRLQTLRLTGDS